MPNIYSTANSSVMSNVQRIIFFYGGRFWYILICLNEYDILLFRNSVKCNLRHIIWEVNKINKKHNTPKWCKFSAA